MKRLNLLLLATLFFFRSWSDSPLPRADATEEGWNAPRLSAVSALFADDVKQGRIAGANLLIARNGQIIAEQSFGTRDVDSGAPMQADTICRIYSMSKVVTAVAVLQLFERNQLYLSEPVVRWLPELKNLQVHAGGSGSLQLVPATNAITVKMLLNHTAGFTYDFFGGSPVHELYQKADLWNSKSLDDFLTKVGQLPLISQPGVAYNYSISDDVLGVLVQRVSGKSFENFVAQNITGPLKMVDTAFDVPPDKQGRLAKLHEVRDGKLQTTPAILGAYSEPGRGIPCGGAGLFSTIGDYARFAQCLLNGGELDGVRILSRKTVELARMNSLPDGVFAFSPADGWGLFSGLRLSVPLSNEPGSVGTFFWSGAATTHFFADPEEQVLALFFTQLVPFDQPRLIPRFHVAVYQALE